MPSNSLLDALMSHCKNQGRSVGDRHWIFEVTTEEARSQVVHVLLEDTRDQRHPRVIFDSPIGPVPTRFDAEKLLRRNAELHVGAICIEDYKTELVNDAGKTEPGTVTYLTLRATHPRVTLDDETACYMLTLVARVADDLEADIYGHDVH